MGVYGRFTRFAVGQNAVHRTHCIKTDKPNKIPYVTDIIESELLTLELNHQSAHTSKCDLERRPADSITYVKLPGGITISVL